MDTSAQATHSACAEVLGPPALLSAGPSRADLPPPRVLRAEKVVGLRGAARSPGGACDETEICSFHSLEDDEATLGRIDAHLLRSRDCIFSLEVRLTGPATAARLVHVVLRSISLAPGEAWSVEGFLGINENGIGKVSLSALDYHLQWRLLNYQIVVEPLAIATLKACDRQVLERSLRAALAGAEVLQTVLEGLSPIVCDDSGGGAHD